MLGSEDDTTISGHCWGRKGLDVAYRIVKLVGNYGESL